jgi:hypothetical protein
MRRCVLERTTNGKSWLGKFYIPTHRDEIAMNGAPDFYGGSFEENKQKQMQMRGFFAFGSE